MRTLLYCIGKWNTDAKLINVFKCSPNPPFCTLTPLSNAHILKCHDSFVECSLPRAPLQSVSNVQIVSPNALLSVIEWRLGSPWLPPTSHHYKRLSKRIHSRDSLSMGLTMLLFPVLRNPSPAFLHPTGFVCLFYLSRAASLLHG